MFSRVQRFLSGAASGKTAQNAASNFLTVAWLGALALLSVPVYIRLLGAEEWGVVAACASMQVFVALLDMGISQIVPRWVAMAKADGTGLHEYTRLFRKIYFGLGILVFALLQLAAHSLAYQWFQLPDGQQTGLELAIRIISVQLLFQLFNNYHLGVWNGLQEQVAANIRSCAFGSLKHASAMLCLALITPQAWLYAAVFACVSMLECLFNAWSVRKLIAKAAPADRGKPLSGRSFFVEVSTLSGGIILGLLVSQMDRVVLSRMVAVEDFGVYMVLITLALSLLQLQVPLTRAFFPLFVEDVQRFGRVKSERLWQLVKLTAVIATTPILLLSIFSEEVLRFWLPLPEMAELGAGPLKLLLWAVAINTIYGCFYQVIVAAGKSYLVIRFNLAALGSALFLVGIADPESGISLGGMVWLVTTSTQLVCIVLWLIWRRA